MFLLPWLFHKRDLNSASFIFQSTVIYIFGGAMKAILKICFEREAS